MVFMSTVFISSHFFKLFLTTGIQAAILLFVWLHDTWKRIQDLDLDPETYGGSDWTKSDL
jgi:hypothetical protein